MPQYDLPLPELERYRPERHEPADFDAFWSRTLAETAAHPLAAVFTEVDAGFTELVTEDVVFAGFGGHPIRGWMLRPRHAEGPLPAVVTYIGYGGGRGHLAEWTALPSAGFAHFVMDLRGQGAGHRRADTVDPGVGGPHFGGFLTLGIESPEGYYYRRVFADAVRAVEAVQGHPAVDPARVVISGGSQGGAIALAAAALTPGAVPVTPVGVIVDVPFLSDVRRAVRLVDTAPYSELVSWLGVQIDPERQERAFSTIDYFDGVNLAARGTMPASFAVALLDDICPPSTVYGAYNSYAGEKTMTVYPFNGHANGGAARIAEHIAFARSLT
ncbi:acetylxylan esterase [Herbiconiux moechotypicola]|uniref:Cephalosporin-C deacetylase n=1 Tax=Herbiconiux moechotypicola TaxID=637393 RepID=A0ABN3E4Y9_9MICO|nr:acetylxylan esterase [Herbiconiux moechotypicola]MCS5731777.1 acetylxylan esterase [Herbiconiux moechotypicola]